MRYHKIDLVIPFNAPALNWMIAHGYEIFPPKEEYKYVLVDVEPGRRPSSRSIASGLGQHSLSRSWSYTALPKKIKGKIRMEGQLHPREKLGIARTVLANERTLMAIIQTALGSFLGGAGLIKFFGHPVFEDIKLKLFPFEKKP